MFTNINEYLGYLVLCAIQWGAPSSVVQLLVQGTFATEQDPTQHNTTRSMPFIGMRENRPNQSLEVAIQSNRQAITNSPQNKREILLRLLALIPRAAKRTDRNGRTALALAAEGSVDVDADVDILHQLWAACP
jgi:hypothetical protein